MLYCIPGGMGRLPANVLSEIRSPATALADLVVQLGYSCHEHPHRRMLERMIRQLESEITLRGGRAGPQIGLC
jgi:hypothetical protein